MAGKKTGKRLLTWVLVLVMALSLLPLNVLAANSGSGMNFDKQLADDKPDGDGNYTIQITAQATGTTTTTTTVKPMDIALVLDVSGSMDEYIPARFEKVENVDKSKTYYVQYPYEFLFWNWTRYREVEWCNDCQAFVRRSLCSDLIAHHNLGQKFHEGEDTFYTKIDEVQKLAALKTAVNGFIDQVAQKSADSSIAVVSFASNAANVSDGLLSVKTYEDTLKAAVNGLNANGATRADLGMQEAASILEDGANEKKVVIMFTDGEPTSGNKFEKDVANATITAAKGMKGKGTEAFTVGVFDSDPDDKTYEYMNYVSSNYPQAQSMSNPGDGRDKGYYTTADSADSLSKVFEGISQTITKPEPVNDKLDEKTVITDTLSDYFTFATGTVEDVKVSAGQRKLTNGRDITVNLDPTTKTVTVTGYDFSAHYKGIGGDDEETLVIEIKVKPDTSYTNWGKSGEYETNEGNATVRLPGNQEPIAEAGSPKAHVNTYKVTYRPGEGIGNEYTDQYYLNETTKQVNANTFTAQEGYEFDCWKDEGGTTYQVNDPITFNKSDVTLTAQWKLIEAADLSVEKTVTKVGKTTVAAGNNTIPTAYPGDEIEWTITVTNSGNAAGDFTLNETLSDIIVKDAEGNAVTLSNNEWHGTVEAGRSVSYTVTYTVKVSDVTENSLVNTVTMNDDGEVSSDPVPTAQKYTVTGTIDNDGTVTESPQTVNHNGRSKAMTFTPANGYEIASVKVKTGNDTKTVTDFDKQSYTYAAQENVTADITVTVETTKRTDLSYTVHYYLKNTTKKVADDKRVDGQTFKADVTEKAIRISGYRVYGDSEKSITIGTGTNEIIFYYTRASRPSTPSKPTLNTGDHYAYVMGYPDGTVRPNGSITRAEVSAILFRLLSDKTRDEYFTTESRFTDVKAGAWYNNSIATLEKAGVIVDTAKGGAFRPNEAITRAELAAMLAQFSDAKPVKGVKFSDVSAEHWAYEAIAIAAKMGWIEGYPDGTFRPDATITRAEMMTLVNRALERVPSDEDHLLSKRVMLTFPDCKSGDWFYIAVQEATNSHTYERAATEKNGDEQWTALRANRDWTLLEK